MPRLPALAALPLILLAPRSGAAQAAYPYPYAPQPCPPACGRPYVPEPAPRRAPLTDWGMMQTATFRGGYATGAQLGAYIALNFRDSDGFAADPGVAVFAGVDRQDIGFRVSPFRFGGFVWQDSVFQGGIVHFSLIDIGADYRSGRNANVSFGSHATFDYTVELSSGIAVQIIDVGPFLGAYAKGSSGPEDTKVLFDFGAQVSSGLVFR